MRRFDGRTILLLPFVCSLGARIAYAEPTRELSISGPREVLEGDPESASVDAHGNITMGLELLELGKASDRGVTAMTPGDKGVVYAGTAGGGVVRVGQSGDAKVISKADNLVVSALAYAKGTLYAATSPDGKIERIEASGTSKTYFDPKAKYIWSLLEDGADLLVATGEPGQILRVGPNGQKGVLLDPGETHIRALIRHPTRGLIAGGGQKGIVYQLNDGKPFALYDSEMEEVTALTFDAKTGDLYASFASESKPGTIDPEKSIGVVAGDGPDSDASPIKGSEVVRISQTGHVTTLWASKREGALGLAFDEKARRLYIATGTHNKGRGRIYAVEVGDRDRLLLAARVEPPHASALMVAPGGGSMLIGTGPSGRILRLGPGYRTESTYVSSEQDLSRISTIGRIWFDADVPTGAKVDVAIRSGNTKEKDKTWSPWSAEIAIKDGGDVKVPDGRYVQIRARLHASSNGKAPLVKSLHASVVRMNVAPTVQEVFLLRRGVYMARMPKEEEKEKTITLSRNVISNLRKDLDEDENKSVRVRQGVRPGWLTLSWRADDPNGDDMIYRVEMRRIDEPTTAWATVANNIEDTFWSFDSRTHADGRYQFRVTASDRPSNPPKLALADHNDSEPQTIDNTPPKITNLRATSPGAGKLHVEADAEDATSLLGTAEVSLNGGPWLMMPAADGLIDSKQEKLVVDVAGSQAPGSPELKPGQHTVLVRVEDEAGNSSTASATLTIR
jgi:hypothetical protein